MCARESKPGNAGICSLPPCAWRLCSFDLKGEPRRLRVAPRYSAACEEGRRDERACGTLPKRRWRHQQRARRADGGALTASSGLTPEPPPPSLALVSWGWGEASRGQCGRKRERRRRAAETSQPIRGELHRPTSGWAGDDSAAHPDRPHSASTTDGNQPRCHRVAETREREFSRRTTNSRRDRDAGTHTTVQNWLLN